ncbi:Cell division protein ZapA-like protein [Candidatus Magnetoovum chiemensis]|nr:Cell division protein ZapA-like protein [Candidatus Magnetoovum chiemensis]
MMSSADVFILGQRYQIKGEESEEYIKMLARYVDKKMSEIYDASPNIHPMKAAILASLSMADEYYKLKEQYETIKTIIDDQASSFNTLEAKTDALTKIFD